ncbi:conjugal transfer protein TraC [Sphingomonas koreensis]|nr:conjugal transfer protein TraC [Sphingomonas koreensis]
MRKVRDYDAELKALDDRARRLKERKLHQFGELVIATGADAMPIDQLVGALLAAIENSDAATKEACRVRGAAFFQRTTRGDAGSRDRAKPGGASSAGSGAQPADADSSAS